MSGLGAALAVARRAAELDLQCGGLGDAVHREVTGEWVGSMFQVPGAGRGSVRWSCRASSVAPRFGAGRCLG